MKLKLDENLPTALVPTLTRLGHDVDTVPDEGLAGRPDPDVWQAAKTSRRFFITQDLDFADVRQFQPGTHPGLLLVRLTTPSRRALIERVEHLFMSEPIETWPGCFIVATDRKIRVRHPGMQPF